MYRICTLILLASLTDASGIDPSLVSNSVSTLVFVPGAWHSPVHYAELTFFLKFAGYETVTARNPSCDSSNPDAQSTQADADAIRNNLILPQLDAGKDIFLVMHSYGGLPGATAGKGLSKSERMAAGKLGGIVGLIFICAFVGKEGQSLKGSLPGQVFDKWVIEYGNGQLGVVDPVQVFYNDVPEPTARFAVAELRNQSEASLSTPGGPPAWADAVFDGRRAYAHTSMDHSIPLAAQDAFLAQSGVEWDVEEFNSSHSPFLSQPKALSEWMVQIMSNYSRPVGADRPEVTGIATS